MEGQPWGLGQWWYIELAWGWYLIIGCWSRRPGAFNYSSTCHPTYPTAFVHRVILAYNHSGVKANLEFERLPGVAGCSTASARSGCPPRLGEVGLWSTFAFFVCRRIAGWISASVHCASYFFARGSASVSWGAQLQSHLQIWELCPGLDSQQSWP